MSLRRWLKKWNWTLISVWTVVVGLCLLFWYWIFHLLGIL